MAATSKDIIIRENDDALGLPAAEPGKREVKAQGRNLPDALEMPPRQSRESFLPKSPRRRWRRQLDVLGFGVLLKWLMVGR